MGFFSGLRTPKIDAAGARALLAEHKATLLDVREPAEWNAGHAREAVHLPLSRLAEAPRKLRNPAATVVVVCRSGNRSRGAVRQLRDMGIEAVNLSGGMRAWASSGGSVVDRKGRPGSVI